MSELNARQRQTIEDMVSTYFSRFDDNLPAQIRVKSATRGQMSQAGSSKYVISDLAHQVHNYLQAGTGMANYVANEALAEALKSIGYKRTSTYAFALASQR